MIIDCHGHVSAPAQLWAYKAVLLASRGSHGRGGVKVTDDEMRAALNAAEIHPKGHLDALSDHGTDVQLISPRPFQLMHSEKPAQARALVRRGMPQRHPPADADVSRKILRGREPAAGRGRSDRARAAGARTLRERARLRRLPAQSRPLRELRRRAARARRPLLVSALRETVRARRPRAHPHRKLALRARELLRASDQRGHDRDPGTAQFRRVQGLPEPQDRRLAWRRRDPLSARALRRAVAARARRRRASATGSSSSISIPCSTPRRRSNC